MLLTDSPVPQVSGQPDYRSRNDELNRLLCAAVVSKSFCKMLLANPEIAVTSGYQGESFNLTVEDRSWLCSTRAANLVDLAANMVNYQQNLRQDSKLNILVDPVPQYVRVH